MPELPDIVVYVEALQQRILGETLLNVRVGNPFLLRTFAPPLAAAFDRKVVQLRRLGKRVAIGLDGDLWLVIHLMIAGRLHWRPPRASLGGKQGLAAFDFATGAMVLTEAGSKRRASLHLVEGEAALRALDPGGLEVLTTDLDHFAAALTKENHTLKRVLADPHVFSGIGNAYSDEILFEAGLSPIALSQKLTNDEIAHLYTATVQTLTMWVERLRQEAGENFPEKVTAFRPEMYVHGRYEQPCRRCTAPIQRIRYADNETNYCVNCQTGGKLLADRALSRLLRKDWPKSLDEMERRMRAP